MNGMKNQFPCPPGGTPRTGSPCRRCPREKRCVSTAQACDKFRVWVRRVLAAARQQTGLAARLAVPPQPPEPAAPVTHPAFRWIERERGRRP